jgi:predicted DCC family thiol-disulfide oxidoreductase YuxK
MAEDSGRAIVLFDGVCNLCNAAVLFIIDRDPREQFRFAPLQSPEAARLLRERGHPLSSAGTGRDVPASIVLIEDGRVSERSAAALRIARRLTGLWPAFYTLMLLPRPVRDLVYDWMARNRYRWFGRQDQCRVPTPELRGRFLETADGGR